MQWETAPLLLAIIRCLKMISTIESHLSGQFDPELFWSFNEMVCYMRHIIIAQMNRY